MWFLLSICMSTAHADAVEGPPEDCPDGQVGTTDHIGPRCVPLECTDGTCDEGPCTHAGMCVVEEERQCGGMTTPGSPCTFTFVEAFDLCDNDDDCSQGTCVVADYCLDTSSKSQGGGACGGCTTGAAASAVWIAGMLPLLFGLARRRTTA